MSLPEQMPAMPASDKQDLAALLRAGTPLILIETRDEPWAVSLFEHVARDLMRPLFLWSTTRGLSRLDRDSAISGTFDEPGELLRHIAQRRDRGIFLLADFQPNLDDAFNVRKIREISRQQGIQNHSLVLIGPAIRLPEELRGLARRFELSAPEPDAIEAVVREEAAAWRKAHGGGRAEFEPGVLEQLVNNLKGLTLKDARRLARNAIFDDGVLDESDLPEVMRAKFELLDPAGVLGFEMETERFSRVAGMPRLKRWLTQRAPVFRAALAPPGLDPPRGILLLGVQGCGKSLAARAVAGLFKVPLLQLDCGALYNRFHGESERNMRESLKSADLMAPCVLWIDEIEKGMATSETDGGTSRRMLATFLTWMAERSSRVFLVATANEIRRLPPELIRKGRFDEVFFVDLPDRAARREILAIHLARRELEPGQFDLDGLAKASEGFSGAELEHAVVSGLYAAYAGSEELDSAHVFAEIEGTRPLSVMMAESIDELRQWAAERAVQA